MAWFDLQDASSYTQAGTVTSITNKASSVAWTEATNPPTYSATGLNGHPCMMPNGTTQRIISTEAAVIAALTNLPAFTLFFVGGVGVADSVETFFASGNSGSTNSTTRFGVSITGAGRWACVTRTSGGSAINAESAGASNNSNHVFRWSGDGSGVSLSVDNAATDPTASAMAPTSAPNRVALCCRPNSGIDSFFAGRFGELVLYTSLLSGGDITTVYNYLQPKWL